MGRSGAGCVASGQPAASDTQPAHVAMLPRVPLSSLSSLCPPCSSTQWLVVTASVRHSLASPSMAVFSLPRRGVQGQCSLNRTHCWGRGGNLGSQSRFLHCPGGLEIFPGLGGSLHSPATVYEWPCISHYSITSALHTRTRPVSISGLLVNTVKVHIPAETLRSSENTTFCHLLRRQRRETSSQTNGDSAVSSGIRTHHPRQSGPSLGLHKLRGMQYVKSYQGQDLFLAWMSQRWAGFSHPNNLEGWEKDKNVFHPLSRGFCLCACFFISKYNMKDHYGSSF